jgi:D-aminoacyl-tRNA deacylase
MNRVQIFSGSAHQLPHHLLMRAVVQRVAEATVTVEGKVVAAIHQGSLVLLGVECGDTLDDVDWLAAKIAALRIFSDEAGKMNRCLTDQGGDLIVVSQFTLHASTKKGSRPSYLRAAQVDISKPLYEQFCQQMESILGKSVGCGVFGADMKVALINDGPVTLIIDSRARE